jgi:hypothetical protein
VKRLIFDRAIKGDAVWSLASWTDFIVSLSELLAFDVPDENDRSSLAAFIRFTNDGAASAAYNPGDLGSHTDIDGLRINLGSIHSVKGRTVDSILIVETEVFKNNARAMDMATVLPHAFGTETRDFNANPVHLAAATNIFVGVTRPRRLLAIAVRKQIAEVALDSAARAQGWNICDLTGRATSS